MTTRIDKWLWAARFFKTRPLAVKACELGRIEANQQRAKAARDVRIGDMLKIRTEAAEFEVEVLALSDTRGPASVAQALYRETESSSAARTAAAAQRRELLHLGGILESRPTGRDRRRLDKLHKL